MRIKSIKGRNFKGNDSFLHELAPVTCFWGDNFEGKTAIGVEAVQLAMAGFIPGISSKPRDIFDQFASGNPMVVEARLDDDEIWSREYFQQGGSVSYNGPDKALPAIAVDPSKFLSLSGPAQNRFLFSCADLGPACKPENLSLTLAASIKNIKLEPHTEAAEKVIDELVHFVTRGIFKANRADLTSQDYLTLLAEELRLQKNGAAATAERMAKTNQGLAQIGQARSAPPQDAEARWNAIQKQKSEVDAEVARLVAIIEGKQERYREVARKLKDSQADNADLLRVDREEADKLLVRWTKELQKLTPISGSDELEKAVCKARLLYADHDKRLAVLNGRIGGMIATIEVAKKVEVCTHCGQKMSAKVKKAQLAAFDTQYKKLLKEVRDESLATKAAEMALTSAGEDWQLYVDYSNKKQEIENAMQQAREIIAGLDIRLTAVTNIEQLTQESAVLYKEATQLGLERDQALRWQAQLAIDYQSAQTDYKNLLAQRADMKSRAEAAATLQMTQIQVKVLKEGCEIVANLQAELVSKSIGPLVQTINALCAEVLLRAPLEFRDGELGSVNPKTKTWYTWKGFSGTQKALAYAALCIALGVKSPMRLVIIDEIGRLHRNRKIDLMGHLVKLCKAEIINQAIVVDVEKPVVDFGSWFKAIELK